MVLALGKLLIKYILLSISFVHIFGSCVASKPASMSIEVPFIQTKYGVSIGCPKAPIDDVKRKKLQEVIEKVKTSRLVQDDAILQSLLELPGAKECQCHLFERSNGWRDNFENKISDLVDSSAGDKAQPIVYINYSSGLAFQDLMIVTKLIVAGYKNITINLVDSYYKEFIEYVNLLTCYQRTSMLTRYANQTGTRADINNAVMSLSYYFSLLSNVHDAQVTINMFDSTQSALQEIKPQSCHVIFCADFGPPREIKIQSENPFFDLYQSPSFEKPLNRKSELQDYFKLATYALKDKAYNCVLTTQLKKRAVLPNESIYDNKIICAKHCNADDMHFYLYHKTNESGFGLVVNNSHSCTVDAQTKQIKITNLHPAKKNDPIVQHDVEFLRPTLEKGDSLNKAQLTLLKDLIKQ